MVSGIELTLRGSAELWPAQIPVEDSSRRCCPELSGSQGFLVIVAGIFPGYRLPTAAHQLLLRLRISYSDSEDRPDPNAGDSMDDRITKVGAVVGLRTLGTITSHLLVFCR